MLILLRLKAQTSGIFKKNETVKEWKKVNLIAPRRIKLTWLIILTHWVTIPKNNEEMITGIYLPSETKKRHHLKSTEIKMYGMIMGLVKAEGW